MTSIPCYTIHLQSADAEMRTSRDNPATVFERQGVVSRKCAGHDV